MPACDQTGVPGLVGFTHFHSSTISGAASWMMARTFASIVPRQSPSFLILSSMDAEADVGATGFFIGSSNARVTQLTCGVTCSGMAGRRRQQKYDSPHSTPVAADQLHASGP